MSAIEAIQGIVADVSAVQQRLLRDVGRVAADPTIASAVVADVAAEELTARTSLFGMGYVVAPERHGGALMSWWQALGDAREVRRLDAGATGTGTVRSYEELEWYAVPRRTGEPHMTGPYVDLLCTDQATLTFTTPLVVDGAFGGVVGADVTVRSFECAVADALRAVGEGALVVTDEGRVAASTDPTVLVQRRLAAGALDGYALERVPGAPLSVAVPR